MFAAFWKFPDAIFSDCRGVRCSFHAEYHALLDLHALVLQRTLYGRPAWSWVAGPMTLACGGGGDSRSIWKERGRDTQSTVNDGGGLRIAL
jgi:hypothetical protein